MVPGPEQGRSIVAVTQTQKAMAFRRLHAEGTFVIPNPWDAGSALMLQALGFEALATTSSGFAFTLGRSDGSATADEVMAHVRSITSVTTVPVSVDLEDGYGPAPADAGSAIERAAEAGAVGGSIEDYDRTGFLYEPGPAAERVAAACEAAAGLGFPFTVTARAENHLRGNPDLDDTIARLRLYEDAGADVLYATGLGSLDDVRAVCEAVTKPVNVLARPGLSGDDLAAAGVRRISVGGGLTWVAVAAAAGAAERMRDAGDFSALASGARPDRWLGG